ncbi:alpha/beta hydrolase [Streptomyces sp. RS10V-4]|uniref:alpha/beta fold hydrolase n=1 Tax=Streptomyces rhizoryzae TaxID=2932493 RepID=UPI0020029BF6|nr:alpha/beta hydrolase [Streptomyces rhizoryzae]MCK7626567.1 alpha/beta hydrolase [Streptomyces rhizoryzae]
MNTYVTAPARLGETPLPDGRLLGWAEWGPEDGIPVLLCPGAATSRWLGCGPDAVAALGIRLVSVDRPGLGASSPLPGRGFADFAADLAHLAAVRGLGRPPLIGNSQGAPFALACAEAGVAGAVALVSGADEVAAPEFAAALPPEIRALVERTATDPAGAETFFGGFTADAMRHLVHGNSPDCDLAVYREPHFAAAYRRALDEGFARGAAAGYARDTVLAMGRWPFRLDRIAVPVDLWYGTHDTSHSPDHGALLATRIPGARRHLVPDTGGALLWTHTGPVLTTLLRRAAGTA